MGNQISVFTKKWAFDFRLIHSLIAPLQQNNCSCLGYFDPLHHKIKKVNTADHEIEESKVWLSLSQQKFVLTCFVRVRDQNLTSLGAVQEQVFTGVNEPSIPSGSEGILLS